MAPRGLALAVVACVLVLVLVLGERVATAEPVCTRGNALATAQLVEPSLPAARAALLTDGAVVPEGAPWPAADAILPIHGAVTFDLGSVRPIPRIFVQLDADQAFEVATSDDAHDWSRRSVESHPTATGMLSRTVPAPAAAARYLRLSPAEPSHTITLAEVRVPCTPEADAAEGLRVVGAHDPPEPPTWVGRALETFTGMTALTPLQDALFKLFIALGTVTWLVVEWALERFRGAAPRRAGNTVLCLLALTAMGAYYNLGAYRFPHFVHEHDVFHYFVGAKYFPEIGYDELYQCSAAAEAEAGFAERVALRAQRDLRTNQIVGGDVVLCGAAECRARFTATRWHAFADDVRYFANTRNVEDWHRVLKDHGFNASPVWITFGRAVARFLPATDATIGHGSRMWSGLVGPLDPLLLLLSLGAVAWAFGVRAAALLTIVFGCNSLSDFSWVGGGFFRELWVTTLVLGVCLSKRGRFFVGGALLGVSVGLQLFPAACVLSVAFALAVEFWKRRTVNPEGRRLLTGAVAALVVLVPLSLLGAGKADAWSAFVANTEKHARTPSGNLMGLPTALSFRTSTRAALLFDENATDPFARVREARHENFHAVWPLEVVGVLLGIFLLYRALRRDADDRLATPWWWIAVLGLPLVALALETSCYYVAWLAVLALLGAERRAVLFAIFGIVLGELTLELVVAELDVKYGLGSAVLVAGVLSVLALSRAPVPRETTLGDSSPR
jgi:hypothetical protein